MSTSFVFFGTPQFSVIILDELKAAGYIPALIVTQEDAPAGRHLVITPPPVKMWAMKHNVQYIQPGSLKDPEVAKNLSDMNYDLFVVASYGKIIPQSILDIPKYGTLNVHPSLLPRLRGPSPIVSAILEEDKTGVTIMLLDALMDHGPIVSQKEIDIPEWPPYGNELEVLLAHEGGKLLAETISGYIDGSIKPVEQDHAQATISKKFVKADMEIDLDADAKMNLRKIRAFAPHAFTFYRHGEKKTRVIIKKAHVADDILILDRVVPEGRKEMSFEDFQRGFRGEKN